MKHHSLPGAGPSTSRPKSSSLVRAAARTSWSSAPIRAEDLTQAFDDGSLLLHYQPQVDVARDWPVIVGYEALARWPRNDGTFIPPDRFIPVAEDCGLIAALDMWVVETVCADLARAAKSGASQGIRTSANVSTRLFKERCFARSIADILTRTGANPTLLTLEITERAVLELDDATLDNLNTFREMGVSLSLDDFGTGFSSLLHLKTLPIQEIKLDRSFVKDLPHEHRDAVIVSATISLAAALGLRVVAEGVEQACQVDWLRSNGCHTIQGFLYGRPAPRHHSRPSG